MCVAGGYTVLACTVCRVYIAHQKGRKMGKRYVSLLTGSMELTAPTKQEEKFAHLLLISKLLSIRVL